MRKNPHGLGNLAERQNHERADTKPHNAAPTHPKLFCVETAKAERRYAEAENAARRSARLFGGERRMAERRDPNSAGAPFRVADRRKGQDSAAQAQDAEPLELDMAGAVPDRHAFGDADA